MREHDQVGANRLFQFPSIALEVVQFRQLLVQIRGFEYVPVCFTHGTLLPHRSQGDSEHFQSPRPESGLGFRCKSSNPCKFHPSRSRAIRKCTNRKNTVVNRAVRKYRNSMNGVRTYMNRMNVVPTYMNRMNGVRTYMNRMNVVRTYMNRGNVVRTYMNRMNGARKYMNIMKY